MAFDAIKGKNFENFYIRRFTVHEKDAEPTSQQRTH